LQRLVFGPALFLSYSNDLIGVLKDIKVTSYADDLYILIEATSIEDLIKKTESTIEKHFEFLDELGMVADKSKTLLIILDHRNSVISESIKGRQTNITVQKTMKVLGFE